MIIPSSSVPNMLATWSGQNGMEAFTEFSAAFMPEAGEDNLLQMESGVWTMADRRADIVAIVFEAPSEERAVELLSQIEIN